LTTAVIDALAYCWLTDNETILHGLEHSSSELSLCSWVGIGEDKTLTFNLIEFYIASQTIKQGP